MKSIKTLYTFLLLLISFAAEAQDVYTHHAKLGQKTTLQLQWTTENYGQIQWQRSLDNGLTWKDIPNATQKEYSFSVANESYFRVAVTGDKACEPITQTHLIKVNNFNVKLLKTGATTATYEISQFNLPKEEIAEWGFCYNYYNLSRNYQNMYRESQGTTLPQGDVFNLTCKNLSPHERYKVRVYFKTKDGSVLYGQGILTETAPGIKWSTEDWTITQTTVAAKLLFDGYNGAIPQVTFLFGTEGNLKTYKLYHSNGQFSSQLISNLTPGTEYTAIAAAEINGERQTITKKVRTMTDYSTYIVDQTVKPVGHKIAWKSSRIQLSPDNIQAEYPRFQRISNDTILLTYHGGDGSGANIDHWRNIYLQRSTDNGKTWSSPEKLMDYKRIFSNDNHGWYRFADPTFTRLRNGWVLMQFIGNANPETNENCQVFIMISKDGGNTWGDPITVGRGRTWEPQIVELPGGELELLVSSEAYWWEHQRNQLCQEILCSRSTDHGQTWTKFKRASYYPNKRDGMPVPVVLQGNKGVLFSIESIGSDKNPSIVHRDLAGEWDATNWDGRNNDHRWVNNNIRGGCAPYTIQLPTGEIVVCGHLTQKGSVWQTCRTQVSIGDNNGKNFESRTMPFLSLPYGQGAYYSSLFLKDNETIWLAITHSYYNGNTCLKNTIEYIEGKILEK